MTAIAPFFIIASIVVFLYAMPEVREFFRSVSNDTQLPWLETPTVEETPTETVVEAADPLDDLASSVGFDPSVFGQIYKNDEN